MSLNLKMKSSRLLEFKTFQRLDSSINFLSFSDRSLRKKSKTLL